MIPMFMMIGAHVIIGTIIRLLGVISIIDVGAKCLK